MKMKIISIFKCNGDSTDVDDCGFFFFKYKSECKLLSIQRNVCVGNINIYLCNCGHSRRCYNAFHNTTRYFDPGLYWLTPPTYVDNVQVKPNVRVFKGSCSRIVSIKFCTNTLFLNTVQ